MDEERRKQQEKLKITINQEKVEQAKEQLKSPTNEDIEATKENQVSNSLSQAVWRGGGGGGIQLVCALRISTVYMYVALCFL